MKFKNRISWLLLSLITNIVLGQSTINIVEAGGNNNGTTDNTSIIEEAIKQVAKKGGGTIYFPAGNYLTGPIKLDSNIVIHIEAGATIIFSNDFGRYLPFVETRWEGVVMKSFCPLFYAFEKNNITITGRGKIDGQGEKWWDEHLKNLAEVKEHGKILNENNWQKMWEAENQGLEVSDYYKSKLNMKFFRPPFIQLYRSKNILIEGITIANSPFWTINPEFCENVSVRGVTINNPPSPNTDGINPESCKNVHISDCHISVDDDCITIKSGRDADGRKYNVPCENITITNCTMTRGYGGLVIGSEMSGGVRKVAVSNCIFDGVDRGIRIKSMRGRGGIVEDITIDNIVMSKISREAFILNLQYENTTKQAVGIETPRFRNIYISNVSGSEIGNVARVIGIEDMPIENISFSNIKMQASNGLNVDMATDVELNNVSINVDTGSPFIFSNTSFLTLQNVKSKNRERKLPLIDLNNCSNVFITSCFPYPGTDVFIQNSGKSENIVLKNNNLVHVAKKVKTENN